jgi:hypothetical protein
MFSCFICSNKHGKIVYFFIGVSLRIPLQLYGLMITRNPEIIHFEKLGPTFFWTSLPSHENFVPNFFGRKFGPAKFRKGSTPHLEKLDPIFQNELFFRFPKPRKVCFHALFVRISTENCLFFYWSITSDTTTII